MEARPNSRIRGDPSTDEVPVVSSLRQPRDTVAREGKLAREILYRVCLRGLRRMDRTRMEIMDMLGEKETKMIDAERLEDEFDVAAAVDALADMEKKGQKPIPFDRVKQTLVDAGLDYDEYERADQVEDQLCLINGSLRKLLTEALELLNDTALGHDDSGYLYSRIDKIRIEMDILDR